MAVSYSCSSEGDPSKSMREMMGPGAVDQMIGGAIRQCWMMMPAEKRTADAVAAEMRRILERAISNFREDASAFGFDL